MPLMNTRESWRLRLVPIALGLGIGLIFFMTSCWWNVFYHHQPSCGNAKAGAEGKPDFYALYSGATLMWQESASLYDLDKQLSVQRPIDPSHANQVLPYLYPPFLALVLMPLAWLSFSAALAAAAIANLLLLGTALMLLIRRLSLGKEQSQWLVLATACNLGVHYALLQGQTSFLALLLLTLFAFAAMQGRSVAAGLWSGLVSFKLQLLWAPTLVLITRRRWRALTICAAVVLALSLFSYALIGPEGTKQFFAVLRRALAGDRFLAINSQEMHNLRALALAIAPAGVADQLWWVVSIAVVGMLVRYMVKMPADNHSELAHRWIKLFLAMALVTPHFHDHDLVLMIIPTAFTLKLYGQIVPPAVSISLVTLGFLPLFRRMLQFPITPVIFLALFLLDLNPERDAPTETSDLKQ